MAFVFDSTPSSLTANSFISLSDANDFFTARFGSDNWDALDDANKEQILSQATRRIDAEYFGGQKTIQLQALTWPRQYVDDKDGYTIPSDTVPKEINYATCEMALYYLDADERTVSESDLEDLESNKIGPLMWKAKAGRKGNQLPTIVDQYLRSVGPGIWRGKRFPSQGVR